MKSIGNDMPILRKRRVSRGLAAERGAGSEVFDAQKTGQRCTVFWAVVDTAAQTAINVSATPVSFQGAWEKNLGFQVQSRIRPFYKPSAMDFSEMTQTGYPDKGLKKKLDIIV